MKENSVQALLFGAVKNKIGPDGALVDEVAAALGISADSAYRRIRGDKTVSLDELYLLSTRYGLSLDHLLNLKTDTIAFQGKYMDPASFHFTEYLNAVGQQVRYMASAKDNAMYYLCKDIPLFHHYQFRDLAAFKYFFWHKTLLQSAAFSTRKIALQQYPDEVFVAGKAALDTYNTLNSFEIWNMESLNGTLRQVEYYHDTQAFANPQELWRVYDALERLFDHLEKQAELGYKFDAADADKQPLGRFNMYYNEVVIGDNSILAVLNGAKVCFITHTGINFMMTRDHQFCENMYSYYHNLLRKSTLISTVSEQERGRFFHSLRRRILHRKQNLAPAT